MKGVYDADTASVVEVVDRLCVLKVGVHLCCRINEPGAEMTFCVRRVLFVSGEFPRGCKGRNDEAETNHCLTVIVEVAGVGEAVMAYVGASRILLVRPPIVSLGEVVVGAAFASFAVRGGDGDWISVGGREDSGAIEFCDEFVGRGAVGCVGWIECKLAGCCTNNRQKLPSRRICHVADQLWAKIR